MSYNLCLNAFNYIILLEHYLSFNKIINQYLEWLNQNIKLFFLKK
jgi:hypothetical protein